MECEACGATRENRASCDLCYHVCLCRHQGRKPETRFEIASTCQWYDPDGPITEKDMREIAAFIRKDELTQFDNYQSTAAY